MIPSSLLLELPSFSLSYSELTYPLMLLLNYFCYLMMDRKKRNNKILIFSWPFTKLCAIYVLLRSSCIWRHFSSQRIYIKKSKQTYTKNFETILNSLPCEKKQIINPFQFAPVSKLGWGGGGGSMQEYFCVKHLCALHLFCIRF